MSRPEHSNDHYSLDLVMMAVGLPMLLFFGALIFVAFANASKTDAYFQATVDARRADLADGTLVATRIDPAVLARVAPSATMGYIVAGQDAVPRIDLARDKNERIKSADLACIAGATEALEGIMVYLDSNDGEKFLNSAVAPDGWKEVCDAAATLAKDEHAED